VACLVLGVRGATSVTGAISISPSAVATKPLTVSNSTAPLIVVGCFSTLSQQFVLPITMPPPVPETPPPLVINATGVGTHAPSLTVVTATANSLVTFTAGLLTPLATFELDFPGTSPAIVFHASTIQSDS
jgi:hypothetical protein